MSARGLSIFNPRSIFNDDLVEAVLNNSIVNHAIGRNKVEMYEEDDFVVAKFEAPGFKSEDFEISFEDNVLTVSGNSKEEKEEVSKKKYYYKEITQESFARSVTVPVRVKGDKAEAEFKDGILTIRMPKAEEAKPKKISIKAN